MNRDRNPYTPHSIISEDSWRQSPSHYTSHRHPELPPTPRRRPPECRKTRRRRIVQIAATVAESANAEGLHVRALCQEADISIGTFYRDFACIESALVAVVERDFEQFQTLVPELMRPAAPAASLKHLMTTMFRAFEHRPDYARRILTALSDSRTKAPEARTRSANLLTACFENALERLHPEDGAARPLGIQARTLQCIWLDTLLRWAFEGVETAAAESELAAFAETLAAPKPSIENSDVVSAPPSDS